ncbi:MAG: hypothetical protein Q7O66_02390 [Dehalococcoidia bacterium]|nr:hypothetical protein [Dehalococcoidia bacterium]
MTMEPSQDYMERQLQLADEALSDAKYLLQDNRLKAAANLFYHNFVEPGKISRQYHRDLIRTFRLRQQTDYERNGEFGEDDVRQAVEKAEGFVAEVKSVVGAA